MTSSHEVGYESNFMVGVITLWSNSLSDFKLTKLFGIENFQVAKDFGKVLITLFVLIFAGLNFRDVKNKKREINDP